MSENNYSLSWVICRLTCLRNEAISYTLLSPDSFFLVFSFCYLFFVEHTVYRMKGVEINSMLEGSCPPRLGVSEDASILINVSFSLFL